MIVKTEKISDTEYAKYSDCPDAYYAEIKYDRDKSSFAGIAFKINDDRNLSFENREEVKIKDVNKFERLFYGMEESYCNAIRETYDLSNRIKGLRILFLVYSDIRSSQVIFGKLTEYICEHIALTSAVPENEREDLIENSGIW